MALARTSRLVYKRKHEPTCAILLASLIVGFHDGFYNIGSSRVPAESMLGSGWLRFPNLNFVKCLHDGCISSPVPAIGLCSMRRRCCSCTSSSSSLELDIGSNHHFPLDHQCGTTGRTGLWAGSQPCHGV